MNLKKEITFIYSDKAEEQLMKPIYNEAKERGYKVLMTMNKFQKCEIGVYCQHKNFPQFSKFSVIMLHDIIQAYGRWPDLWYIEPWNKYNVGILPGNRWVENWAQCSQYFYARPKNGMYKVGWPKADVLAGIDGKSNREQFYKEHNMDINKPTILYAPAWENDGKQDEFVQAMLKLDVNILIKQAPFNEKEFPHICKNIRDMYELHKDNKRVTLLDVSENIFTAIAVSDVLVSEESSTMCEAVLMGVPAVSVSDWLIPDTTPSRYPKDDYDFVVKTKIAELGECISAIISDYEKYKKDAIEYSTYNYSNIGCTSKKIMDIIDGYVEKKEIPLESIEANKTSRVPLKKYIKFKMICAKREITENYVKRYKLLNYVYNLYRKVCRKSYIKLEN